MFDFSDLLYLRRGNQHLFTWKRTVGHCELSSSSLRHIASSLSPLEHDCRPEVSDNKMYITVIY